MDININQLLERLRASGSFEPDVQPKPKLYGVDCPICNNQGKIVTVRDGMIFARECECMEARRSLHRARKSGLGDLLDECTFDNFKTPNRETAFLKQKAQEYTRLTDGKWFFVHGTPGTGKTHVCTAICNSFINSGAKVKYVIWSEIAQKLRAVINEPEYQMLMEELKSADVLYIDDLLKGNPSDADIKRAFEIINARYNQRRKKTIISTERDLRYINNLDPAVAGRINQRAKGFCLKIEGINWRT